MNAIKEILRFLDSRKVSEAFSSDLREVISVETDLEEAVLSAIRSERDVIIAGDAGSGKTHLINTIMPALAKETKVVRWPEDRPNGSQYVFVVEDATEALDELGPDLFETGPDECQSIVVAINEGPLLRLAHKHPESIYSSSLEMLRSIQRGVRPASNEAAPVLVNAAGFDPVEQDAVSEIIARDFMEEVVDTVDCSCPNAAVCPRRAAWRLLDSDAVRDRVNDLVSLANVHGQPVLFREIWNFIADVALGGSCDSRPPSSPWFWRVFHGESELSARIHKTTDPNLVVFPRAEAHLWYGDLSSEKLELLEGVERKDLVQPPSEGVPYDDASYEWLKSQIFFLVSANSLAEVLREEIDLALSEAVAMNDTATVVASLNRYMTYGTWESGDQRLSLDLWTDFGIQKRLERVHGQVSLGQVSTTDFNLKRSLAVANHSDDQLQLLGPRFYLVHEAAGASFLLTTNGLDLIKGGRSYRTSDRPHTDMEWYLTRFYTDIARSLSKERVLQVLNLDFDQMTSKRRRYSLSPELNSVEPETGI